MQFLALLISLTFAQEQPQGIRVTAPEICQQECISFDLNNCRTTQTPTDTNSWKQVTSQLASCICTAIQNNPSCQMCLVTKATTASVYWSKLDTACSRNEGNIEIAKLWGIDLLSKDPGSNLKPDEGQSWAATASMAVVVVAALMF